MFNNHTITLITDINLVINDLRNIDFVSMIAITTSSYPDYPNVYYAGILLPPTEILMDWADGKQEAMNIGYPNYLANDKECDDMIVAMFALLTTKNVILYIPKDEYDVFGAHLLKHLYYMYGLVCNTPFSRFSIMPEKIPLIITKFFMMNTMEADQYLATYPANYMLPDIVINKLAMEVRPFNRPASFEEYKDYFNKINASKAIPTQKVNMLTFIEDGGKKK